MYPFPMAAYRVLSIFLLGLLVSTATAQPSGDDITLFTVADRPVPASEFIYLYTKNHPDEPGQYSREKVMEYLDLYVKFKLKVEEARHRQLDTVQAFLTEFNSYREELRKPYLPDNDLIDRLTRLTYERLKEEIRASHILISVPNDASAADTLAAFEKIQELRQRAVNGEDFGMLAQQYSEDPSARTNRGELGWFTALQMVYPFENAAYETQVGEISPVVRTSYGYHIVKVTDRRPARGEVQVSHIMLNTGEGYDAEEARTTIFDLYNRLQQGADWASLCREYSQDPGSRDAGGRLRPFGVRGIGVPEFEEIAFQLQNPGDISDPFQTRFGWHIIRLESRTPLPDFETIEARLKNQVSRDERAHLSRAAIRLKVRNELGFQENSDEKERVIALADSTLTRGKWSPPANVNHAAVLFTLQNQRHTVGEFIAYVQHKQKATHLQPGKYLEQLYDDFVNHAQGLALEEKIKRDNPSFRWLLNEYYEGMLLFEIMEEEVWNKASSDSLGQVKYYESRPDHYHADERVRAVIYASSAKGDMVELEKLLRKRDTVGVDSFVDGKRIRTERGAFEKEDRLVLQKIEWVPGIHASENNGVHYLVDVIEILPPGRETFVEARAEVISDYQTYVEERWIDALRQKYPVKMNRKGIRFLEKQLVKK